MQADTEALRAALRASEERHAQHEADLFRQAQELTNVSFAPEVARHDLTREADDRLARVEITQKELTRRLSAVRLPAYLAPCSHCHPVTDQYVGWVGRGSDREVVERTGSQFCNSYCV